jgi:hypothetical protein
MELNEIWWNLQRDLCDSEEMFKIYQDDIFYKGDIMKQIKNGKTWAGTLEKKNYIFRMDDPIFIQKNTIQNPFIIEPRGDICLGFEFSKDVYIDIYISGELINKNLYCEKNKITYLKEPLILFVMYWSKVKIVVHEDVEIKCLYTMIDNKYRMVISDKNYCLNTCYNQHGVVYTNMNKEKKEELLSKGYLDLSFLCINYITLQNKKKEEIKKYREELVLKAWHPSRVEEWCM